jgi:hypothetical protein
MDFLDANVQSELVTVGCISIAWLSLYMLVRHVLCPSFTAENSNRVVSLVHAVIGFIWPLFVIEWTSLRANIGSPTTDTQLNVLRCSLGYFVYDMFCCFAIELTTTGIDVATAFHHLVTIVGMTVGVFQKISGHELVLCLIMMEASNPCMHARYILRELKLGKSGIAQLNDVLFACTFLLCRNILGTPVVWWTLTSPSPPLLVKAGSVGIALVSWFWAHKLVAMILRKIKKTPSSANGVKDE